MSGILYAIIHEIRLGEHVRRLRSIEGSLSTRRLGRFPHHLGEIGKLFDGAKKLTILADCADYGSFFAPEEHKVLHDAVYRFSKAEGHQVQILVAGPPASLTAASPWAVEDLPRIPAIKKKYWSKYIKTVRKDQPFLKWLGEVTNVSASHPNPKLTLFEQWLTSYSSEAPTGLRETLLHTKAVCDGSKTLEADGASAEAFLALLRSRQYWFEKLLAAAGADIRHVQESTALFFWISQKTCEPVRPQEDGIALFAFPNPSGGEGALAFRTIDPDLIKTFEGIFDKFWHQTSTKSVAAPGS